MSVNTSDPVVEECLAALKILNKDMETLSERFRSSKVLSETYLEISQSLRSQQIEILKLLAEITREPVDRWRKIAEG